MEQEKYMPIRAYGYKQLHTPKAALSNREKGELRSQIIFDWIYRFRYSTLNVLVELCATTEDSNQQKTQIRDLIRRLVKNGYLREFDLVTAVTKKGYVLTDSGFMLMQQYRFEEEFSNRIFKETHKLTASNFIHDLCIQLFVASQIKKSKGACGYLNEHEIRAFHSDDLKGKKLDAVITAPKQRLYGIEVEITQKSNGRLISALRENNKLIDSYMIDQIYYVVPTPGKQRLIQKVIDFLNGKNISEGDIYAGNFTVVTAEAINRLIKGGK